MMISQSVRELSLDKQTDKQTDRQTNRQTNILAKIVKFWQVTSKIHVEIGSLFQLGNMFKQWNEFIDINASEKV